MDFVDICFRSKKQQLLIPLIVFSIMFPRRKEHAKLMKVHREKERISSYIGYEFVLASPLHQGSTLMERATDARHHVKVRTRRLAINGMIDVMINGMVNGRDGFQDKVAQQKEI
jgi:hypothetical protein